MPVRNFAWKVGACVSSAILIAAVWFSYPGEQHQRAFAATSSTFPSGQYLAATDGGSSGGMAQYGVRLQQSTSPSATLQAIADWHSYAVGRSERGVGLSAPLQDRLATADWNARQAGSASITPQQLASAATNLVNAQLATMTREQQEALFEQNMTERTPKGAFGLNQDNDYVTASLSGGKWTVSISVDAFSARKTFFKTNAPGMVSSGTNFYPGEAILVLYSVAADDMGFGGQFVSKCKKAISDLTGLDMSTGYLHGPNGYLFRRPLSTFLTEQAMGQFFSELGF